MSNEALIQLLLAIIGVLLSTLFTFLLNQIRRDIGELKDMFVRHVRNSKIHVNMGHLPDEGGSI